MRRTRRLAAAAALVVASLLMTGCGRSDESAAGPAEATALGSGKASGTVTLWAMGTEGELLPEFVKTFEQENPGVDVEVTAIPWDAAHNKFQTAIAGGQTPDMAMMGSTWMTDFGSAFATVPTDLDTSGFFPGAVQSTQVNGRAAGVPWYVDTRVLYYRTDLAAAAGWTKPPATWDELHQMASDMKSKAGAEWGIRMPAGNDSYQGSLWMPLSNGATLTDGSKWTLDTPQQVEAYEYYNSFFTDKLSNPDTDISPGAAEADFVSGATPMFIEGPFMRSQLAKLGGEGFDQKYASAVLPTKVSSTSFSGGANLVVFDQSKNKDAAWRLVQWLSDPKTQVSWYQTSTDLPASQQAWQDPSLSGDANLAVFGEQLKTAVAPPANPTWTQVAAAGDTELEKIRRGQESVQDGLKALQQQADAIGLG
ncbi:carbohydrate ABC transporter substrate-binding protein, CUT1 family [Quadrisphaera granulorum]|uniref:Carbohydrate ABC transporter substrate-binding protein (CUT1 family) n=1 Tax=Quadrisphaera granulorum TaxID=317664 RepID=A0A315ZX68_9ACTN|nr:extracellular solute-binding protein [Quadrisphaera granulorum]PWJ50236.1 carbohydrate ABC transporter substrate-binding protein (CUT1 family) [Quadrisphaera granulorum]SZE98002.1 carbohydrate ABC transporter substrate-binding protein, CUT1 family [Quadrisphaera granulorum]